MKGIRNRLFDMSSSLSGTGYSSESGDELQPEITVNTNEWDSKRCQVASGVMKGWRPTMEDRHCVRLKLARPRAKKKGSRGNASYFGVFDGHGGDEVSQLLEREVPDRLKALLAKEKRFSERAVKRAVRAAYLGIDKDLIDGRFSTGARHFAGSTATSVVLTADEVIVGHVGDSRAIASVRGKCVALTEDHKPQDPEEMRRGKAAGQEVWMRSLLGMEQWRVGPLAMSRSIGDVLLKKNPKLPQEQQAVIATPSFKVLKADDVDFMVLGSDGVFEVMENDAVHDFVSERIHDGMGLAKICTELCHSCVSRNPNKREQFIGRDNMTIIIVRFSGRTSRDRELFELNQYASEFLRSRKGSRSSKSSSSDRSRRSNGRRTIVNLSRRSSISATSARSGANSTKSGNNSTVSVPSSTRSRTKSKSQSKSKSKSRSKSNSKSKSGSSS
jgi:protein phosphatase 2C family protein 2/3